MPSIKRRLSLFTGLTADQSFTSTSTMGSNASDKTCKSGPVSSTLPRSKPGFKRRLTITLESIFVPRGRSSRRRAEAHADRDTEGNQSRWSYVSRSPSPPSPDIRPPSGLGHRASFHKSKPGFKDCVPELEPQDLTVSDLPYVEERQIHSASLWRDHYGPPYASGFYTESSPNLTIAVPPNSMSTFHSHHSAAREKPCRRPSTANLPTCVRPSFLFSQSRKTRKPLCVNTSFASLARPNPTVIPPKALALILSYCSKDDLTSSARVSRAFRDAVVPILYQGIHFDDIDPHLRTSCLQTLASQPDIAKHVHAFSWNVLHPTANTPDITRTYFLGHALQNMYALRSLALSHSDTRLLAHVSARLTTFISRGLSSLDASAALAAWLVTQPSITSLVLPDMFCLPLAPHALPKLTSFAGTTSVACAVVPERPVRDVAVHICAPIYDGLRPSELMEGIAESKVVVETLRLSMTGRIDVRTHERVLMAAGAKLPNLKEIHIQWSLEPQDLYPHITSVLRRFANLESLVLQMDTNYCDNMDSPGRSAKEDVTAAIWHRQCPSLRRIEFLSGAVWFAR